MAFEFKPGDKVKAINQPHGWGRVKKGDIGVVITAGGIIHVNFPNQKYWGASDSDLELIERLAPIKPKLPELTPIDKKILEALKAGDWGCQKQSVINLVSAMQSVNFAPYMEEE